MKILQAFTEHYYHTVPEELKTIILSPEREAIFKYLAQISAKRFPEFVKDILLFVEGHKLFDITEGPGDEKQDILTITASGERHLTQCKHTINYKHHYPDNEIDLLFAACIRKKCTKGLFVTNSDLTPQAKRYITDKEFARFRPDLPDIDYWNGERIWQRIATSNAILNKWFSGMCQAHGLRRFSFDLVIQRFPKGDTNSIKFEDFIKTLSKKCNINKLQDGQFYEVKLNKNISFTISNWFHSDLDLGVPYVGPELDGHLINIPLHALKIQITVANEIGQYNPCVYSHLVVRYIGDEALPNLPKNEWWYLVATKPQAFVFLQDVVEAKIISVSHAQSYIRVATMPTVIEKDWIFLKNKDYKRFLENKGDELQWRHISTGVKVTLLLEQRPHPIAVYEQHIRQLRLVKQISKYKFRSVPNVSQEIIDMVRRTVDPKWTLMLSNDNILFWAFPPNENSKRVREVEDTLDRRGISVLHVRDEDKEKVIGLIQIYPPEPAWSFVDSESNLVTPIWLNRRIIWLSKEVNVTMPQQTKTWFELMKLKIQYEAQHGYDFMQGNAEVSITSEEIQGFLFDLMTIRGDRMLDIAFRDGKTSVNLRIREKSLKSTITVLPKYLKEMNDIIKRIENLIT